MKIVVNRCYGSFELSDEAKDRIRELKGLGRYEPVRVGAQDSALIQVVEELGREASGYYSNLQVVDIPDNATDWILKEYDGAEIIYYVLDGKIHEL